MITDNKVTALVHKDVFYWKNLTTLLSLEEAVGYANEVKRTVAQPAIRYFLTDNRGSNGVYSQEVNAVWNELMAFVCQNVERNAVICINTLQKMQIDRIARESRADHIIKAFVEEKEALAYVGLSHFPFK